jgi:prophage regulatory protein
MENDRIRKLPWVLDKVALRKTTIYDLIKRGLFPAPIRLGLRSVGWRQGDIEGWLASRPRVRL